MAIEVKCPACLKTFKVVDGSEGKKGACPYCSTFVVVGGRRPLDETPKPPEPPWSPENVFPIFAGHTGQVNSVSFSEGGSIAISAGDDGTVRFWDVESGRETLKLAGHDGAVNCAVLSRDGTFALSGGADGTVRLWHAIKATCVRVLEGHKGPVKSVAIYPLGGYVYSAGADGTVRMWQMSTGKCPRILKKHKGSVNAVAVDAEGKAAITAGSDGTVRLWRCDKGKEVGKLIGHRGPVYCAAFNRDGAFAISGSEDRNAIIWDVEGQKIVKTLEAHHAAVKSASISSDNRSAATGGADWTLRIWDIDGAEAVLTIEDEEQRITSTVFQPGADFVLAGYSGGAMRLWNARTGRLARTFGGTEHSQNTRCASCGKVFAMAARLSGFEGLCPFCRVKFKANPYSPAKSREAVARGLAEMAAGRLERAEAEFDEAIRQQGDNNEAILNAIVCRNRMGIQLEEAAKYTEALTIADEAVRLYAANKSWPVEIHVQAKQEAYAAAFLAGKICRYHLSNPARAVQYLRYAQKLNSTFEVEDMLAHTPAGPAAEDA
jgi:WD40 repeat protein